MRGIWTDENKLKIWLQIELLASEALVADGIVPRRDFEKMKAGADLCFADTKALTERAKELEKTLNHDVIGFTTAVTEKINDPASRWLHFGLTSSGYPHQGCGKPAQSDRRKSTRTSIHALHRTQSWYSRRTNNLRPQDGIDV